MQASLFDEVGFYSPASEWTAPATALRQVTRERIPSPVTQEAGQVAPPREVGKLNLGSVQGHPVTLAGREYRLHRDCGEFVWLAALDAGIAGPFYWHRKDAITDEGSIRTEDRTTRSDRAERIKAAQARLAPCDVNGPEYMAALRDLRAAMREGDRG